KRISRRTPKTRPTPPEEAFMHSPARRSARRAEKKDPTPSTTHNPSSGAVRAFAAAALVLTILSNGCGGAEKGDRAASASAALTSCPTLSTSTLGLTPNFECIAIDDDGHR